MNEERIDELLSIWQRASDAGQDVSTEELCREHPELKEEVRRQIELLKRSSQARTDRINSEPDLSDSATRVDDGSAVVRKKPGSALHPGDVLGNYRIISKLGQGGMGQVFKAEHLRMQRIVALKVLPPTLSWDKGVIARFQREVHAAAKLSHPNIVTAFDADEANGQHYLVMEYVEGNDLAEIVRKQGPFDLLTAVDCIIQAARGLEYAHRRGVIHRDIKPSNLLFAPSDRHESDSSAEAGPSSGHVIKILDMGLARLDSSDGTATADLTNTGTVMGTVDYMSPEQALDTRQANAQSDIYSLGCTLWYLLGGRSVYEGDTVMKRLVAHREHAVPSLRTKLVEDSQRRSELTGLDAQLTSLDAVFQKMVAKKPSDRYASMTDVIRSLQSIEQSLKALNIPSSVDFVPSGETRQLSLASSDSMADSDISSPTMIVSQQAVIAPESPKLHMQIGTGKGQRSTPQKRRLRSLLGLVGLAVMLLLGVIIIKIKKPDGTVTEVKVPEGTEVDLSSIPKGSKVEITESDKKPNAPGKASTGWHGWPAEAPPAAIAPFDATKAKQHQEAWAKYLGVPVEYTNSLGMNFRLIPPGEFTMGSTEKEIEAALKDVNPNDKHWQACIRSEAPQHKVILTQPIYLGAHEVMQAEYEKVMGTNPSHFALLGAGKDAVTGLTTAKHPVEMVSWNDAAEFCAKLSQQEKFKPSNFSSRETIMPLDRTGYRLPSEAEWEFACRAGTGTKYWIGDNDDDLVRAGWVGGDVGSRTHAAGELKANPFGLADMHGNVWEWVQDSWDATWYGQFREKPAVNPSSPPIAGSRQVLRGGNWAYSLSTCRSSHRYASVPSGRGNFIGFRVTLPVDAVRQALKVTGQPKPATLANAADAFDPAAERKAAEWIVKFGDCTVYGEPEVFLGQPSRDQPVLPKGPFFVREVFLSGVDNAGLQALAGCRRLQQVRFLGDNGKVTVAGLRALTASRSLKKLEIAGASIGAGFGELLKSWPLLEELSLRGAPVAGDVLAAFPDCPKLKVLDVGRVAAVTDANMKSLAERCPNLERLTLGDGSDLSEFTPQPLASLARLKQVSLTAEKLDDAGLAVLKALPSLTEVTLQGAGISQSLPKLLALESKWRVLMLDNSSNKSPLTEADFATLARTRGLRELHLRGPAPVTDAALLQLAETLDLQRLKLSQTAVAPTGAVPYSESGLAKFRERRPDVHLSVELTDYLASSSIPFAVVQQLDQTDPLPAWELPAGAPQPVVVPCSPEDAIARQKAWAEFLKRPVIEELDVAEVARLRKEGNKREGEAPAEPRGGNKGDQPKDGSAGASPSQPLKFALIPPGEFRRMFTREFQGEYEPGTPVRRLRINKPFAISTTEVTWDQFRQFVEATGYQTEAELNGVGGRDRDGKLDPQGKITWRNPGWKVDPQEPVTQVTSRDAAAFCDWLTEAEQRKLPGNAGDDANTKTTRRLAPLGYYRLPTEAEWHHACRAGSSHKYVVSPDAKDLAEYAWSKESLDPDPQANPLHRVGTKKPNPFGLHDMQGNVWEHVSECYQLAQTPYLRGHDLIGAPVGGVSGGSWMDPHTLLTPTEPLSGWSTASSNIGFRVVRQLDDAPQPGWLERPLVLNPGQSLSRLALVPRPDPIPGLRSWSVELAGTHGGVSGFVPVASSPKGDLIATGNEYGKISLWDREGKYRGALLGHDGRVVSLHFSPDGRWLASCDCVYGVRGVLGHSVRIWDIESRSLRTVIPISPIGTSRPSEVAFSPDSSQLAVTQYHWSAGGFFLVDVATGRIQQPNLSGDHNIGIAWSPDGTKLASVSDRLRIWDSRTLKLLQEGDLTPHRLLSHKVGWSPDGKWLATTHEGGKLAIRAATTLKVERTIGNNAVDFQWLPDSQRVALAQDGSSIEIFNGMTGEVATKIPEHANLTLLDNGRELAIPAYAGLHIYDTTTGKLLRESPRVGAVWGYDALHAVSPKGDELMSFFGSSTMRVTDTATGREKRTIPLAVPIGGPALSPNGALFAGFNANDGSTGLILDATSGAFVADLPHGNATFASWTWSPDSQRLATGTTDNKVRLWNIAETKVEHELVGHTGTVAHLSWSPDGTRLASAAEDQTVHLWDTRTGKLVASYDKFPEATQFHGILNMVRRLAWSHDGRQLWIGMTNHIISLDPETGTFGPMENASNGNVVTFLNPSPDGQRLLVRALEDWTFVRDHQAPTPRLLGQNLGWTAEWHPDSRRFLGWDGYYGSVGFDVETNRRLGTHFPWLVDKHWLTIGPTGHYVGSPGIEAHIVYVAQHDDGSQRTYTPTEFAEKFGWKNDPEKAELLGK